MKPFEQLYIRKQLKKEKRYLDNILRECDPDIVLDNDQRRAVLNDEDNCLVVAGAGAGKTTTVAAKVKYLVDRKGIDCSQILVISYTNRAIDELKRRINGELGIKCPVATFHSVGNAFLRGRTSGRKQTAGRDQTSGRDQTFRRNQTVGCGRIADSSCLRDVVQHFFQGLVLEDEVVCSSLIHFIAFYFDAPYENNGPEITMGSDPDSCPEYRKEQLYEHIPRPGMYDHISRSRFTTLKSELGEIRRRIVDAQTKKTVTILAEIVRTEEEAAIANFLYLNGIDYEYQDLYKYDVFREGRPYTPDFRIRQGEKECWIEHFGISEEGMAGRHSKEELLKYRKAKRESELLHRAYGTKCIFIFSSYKDGRPMIAHLREELEEAGFTLCEKPAAEVLRELVFKQENRYFRHLIPLICRFIVNFKTNGCTEEDFERMMRPAREKRIRQEYARDERTLLFLEVCRACFREYERYLRGSRAVDFQDMINESARILREMKEQDWKPDYKYIIVDEYQDISRQRFDLVSALRDVTKAKIVAVGDDWQSVFAFSGSDISLFRKFAENTDHAGLLKIVRTYRNSQELIDIAGHFIQKNEAQIRKDLISGRHIKDPVIIFTYDSRYTTGNAGAGSGALYAPAHAVESALEHIIESGGTPDAGGQKILLLGRFNFDADMLTRSGLFEYEKCGGRLRSVNYPDLDLTFLTAHSAKGLGFDNVIVLNGRNGTYGFPAKIEDDPVLSLVVQDDRSIEYAEERRLFYVAMTRTKNRVYFIAPEEDPSEFLLELKHDHKNVALKGPWNDDPGHRPFYRKTCPICGFPLMLKYKAAYGLRLWQCTNEPELCGFMTNEPSAGKLSVIRCGRCRDGFLIIRPARKRGRYILECTNYADDGSGCTCSMRPKEYFARMKAARY